MADGTLTRTCTMCKARKPEDAFYWKQRGKKRSSHCKECHKGITHRYYRENRADYMRLGRERKRKNREHNRKRVRQLQSSTPCMDCGQHFHFAAMQFDHVRGEKRENVSTLINEGHGPEIIDAEIAKCDLVCANCHAVRTYRRQTGEAAVNVGCR